MKFQLRPRVSDRVDRANRPKPSLKPARMPRERGETKLARSRLAATCAGIMVFLCGAPSDAKESTIANEQL